jgi:hypothetical protein
MLNAVFPTEVILMSKWKPDEEMIRKQIEIFKQYYEWDQKNMPDNLRHLEALEREIEALQWTIGELGENPWTKKYSDVRLVELDELEKALDKVHIDYTLMEDRLLMWNSDYDSAKGTNNTRNSIKIRSYDLA